MFTFVTGGNQYVWLLQGSLYLHLFMFNTFVILFFLENIIQVNSTWIQDGIIVFFMNLNNLLNFRALLETVPSWVKYLIILVFNTRNVNTDFKYYTSWYMYTTENVIQKDTQNKSNIPRRKEGIFIFIPKKAYTFKSKANIKVVKNWSRKEYEKKKICKCLGNNCKIALFKKHTL